uniref:Uncharacterized protein n=1 Tax=Corvus moneduloides TaxID=1196302 RepID=A0A8C3DWR4_CORMO
MLKMDHANVTQAMLDAESPSTEKNNSNEYFYILIVMSFYGIFLIGIMLGMGTFCASLLELNSPFEVRKIVPIYIFKESRLSALFKPV